MTKWFSIITRAFLGGVLFFILIGGSIPKAVAQDANNILLTRCSTCHQVMSNGQLERISEIRKTPEGWDMTLFRMQLWHGVKFSVEERQILVKHLSDTQGLAPEETARYRPILERRPGYIEPAEDETLTVMCARCHTYGRLALQRRDGTEWLKLIHTHVGQYPTLEYQALSRDREWWKIATAELPTKLASLYPLSTSAWEKWSKKLTFDPAGTWRVSGRTPGKGSYTEYAYITKDKKAADTYDVRYKWRYETGEQLDGRGVAILYTGYEWRGSVTLGGDDYLEVFTLSEDGNQLSGRAFKADADEIGNEFHALRIREGTSAIVGVQPSYIKAGETKEIIIHGVGLGGKISLGSDIQIVDTLYYLQDSIKVIAKAWRDAKLGKQDVMVGETEGKRRLTVYQQIDSVKVTPDYTIARVGGAGGPIPPVKAQFEAVAYMNGADGKSNTEDDIPIGVMPATWKVDNFDGLATEMQDMKFAGSIDQSGLFHPAGAGPNPKRMFSGNNAGNLLVKAQVQDGSQSVSGSAQLIVTVQRWVDPPIR